MKQTDTSQVLKLAGKYGFLRASDLRQRRIPRTYLYRLKKRGKLIQISRGVFALPDHNAGELQSLFEASLRVPDGVICLLSALRYHGLTTQTPHHVWLAIDRTAWRPRVDDIPVRIMRFSGAALREGIQTHHVAGITLRVYNQAKTVADCFKYRNKIGLEVALEALRECWRAGGATMDELFKYAVICRVANFMRPYLESLV